MGVEVPFALGAAVARPDRPVFVLMGDGGFGWHGMEYDTLVRHGLPMVGIVFDNAGFTAGPAAAGTGRELGYQRYDLMVAGFGGHGEFVEKPGDIAPALQRAVASGKPALVNVCVDPDAQSAGGLLGALGSVRARPVTRCGSVLRSHLGHEEVETGQSVRRDIPAQDDPPDLGDPSEDLGGGAVGQRSGPEDSRPDRQRHRVDVDVDEQVAVGDGGLDRGLGQ